MWARIFRLLTGLSAGGLAACAALDPEPAGPNAAPDPAQLGPFPVGVRTETFVDVTRGRTLVTEIWYPATASARGDAGAIYRIADALPESMRDDFGDLGELATSAVRDAKLDAGHGPYPLVLFSHGNAAVRFQSTYLVVPLASHGYVVAAPDHAGNTLADFVALGGGNFDLGSVLQSYQDRPLDLSVVIRELKDSDLAESIDFESIGVVGHSFGGVTALRAIALDARIDAAVSQAPASYELSWFDMDRELEEVRLPIMLQAGGLDRLNPDDPTVDSIWEHVAPPGWYVHLHRAGHFTFSDFCDVSLDAIAAAKEAGIGDVLDDGCGPENIPSALARAIIDQETIGFLNVYLRGSLASTAFLRQESVDSNEVTVEVRD